MGEYYTNKDSIEEVLDNPSHPHRAQVMQDIISHVHEMSHDKDGTRIVQSAIQYGTSSEQEALVKGVRKHVKDLIWSPEGNHVIQSFIEQTTCADFFADELMDSAVEVCNHRFGCRVMCRLLEHYENKESTKKLMEEALKEVGDICRHKMGHYVIQKIIETEPGSDSQRAKVLEALGNEPINMAKDRNAHHVLDLVIDAKTVSDEEKQKLKQAMLKEKDESGEPKVIALFKQTPHQSGRPAGKILAFLGQDVPSTAARSQASK